MFYQNLVSSNSFIFSKQLISMVKATEIYGLLYFVFFNNDFLKKVLCLLLLASIFMLVYLFILASIFSNICSI